MNLIHRLRQNELLAHGIVPWSVLLTSAAALAVVLLAQTRSRGLPGVPDVTPASPGWTFSFVLFAGVGALIVQRVGGSPVGWAFWALGVLAVTGELLNEYAIRALLVDVSLPGGDLAAWLALGLGPLAFANVPVLLFRFPTGAPLSRRWQVLEWVLAVDLAAIVVAWLATYPHRGVGLLTNDDIIPGAALSNAITSVALPIMLAIILAAAVNVVVRFRRSTGVERLQLKWFFTAAVLVFASIAVSELVPGAATYGTAFEWLDVLAFALLPLAVGVAMVRYRLYDFDRFLSRVVTYALLSALLVGMYTALVLGVGSALSLGDSDLLVATSTLAVAATFQPLRRRVQHLVDRRFARSRYDAAAVAGEFAARLRDEVHLEQVTAELGDVVHGTIAPAHLSLWLAPQAADAAARA